MPVSNLRFVILGDDRASAAFNRFAGNVDKASRAVERNRASMKQNRTGEYMADGGTGPVALTAD